MYKRYERYKDSGIEWIGDVPEHWELKRLKHLCKIKSSNIDKKDEYEIKAFVVHYNDVIKHPVVDNDTELGLTSCTIKQFESCKLKFRDIVITKDSMDVTNIADVSIIKDNKRDLVCGYHLYILTVDKNCALADYYYYSFKLEALKEFFLVLADGVTIIGLSRSELYNTTFPRPNSDEQKAIANYLDHKTSEIDSLIADKEALIKKLEEYKQSIITEAVTKGLNPDVKMKDSGIEWIGEIPEHWSIVKMRYLLDKIKTGSTPTTQNQSYFDGDIDWFTPADILDIKLASSKRKISPQALIDGEAILFEENTVLLVGIGATIGKIAITDKKCSSNQQITGLTTKSNRMLPLYLTYWLHINQNLIKAFSNNTTLPILNNEGIRSLYCILPTLKEQTTIVNYLEQKALHIDELIHDIEDHKDQLREYRQSLIFEAVTGKIDVRDYQLERSEQFA